MKKNHKYEVTWRDAYGENRWYNLKECLSISPPMISSVGWMVGESKAYLCLALSKSTVNGEDIYGLVKFIPRGSITKTKEL